MIKTIDAIMLKCCYFIANIEQALSRPAEILRSGAWIDEGR